jgi:hypothetical protein
LAAAQLKQGFSMTDNSDVLLEYRQNGRETWAIRFFPNGLVEEYSNQYLTFENGQIVSHSQPLKWRKVAQLNSNELEKFLTTLRESGFFSLPDEVGNLGQVRDGTLFTWKISLDGRQKTVLSAGSAASENPSLKSLSSLVQRITAEAFDREGKQKRSAA